MVDPQMKELMANALFRADDFEQVWLELDQLYDTLGFVDYWSDEEKISEYKWVTQQLTKYMGTKQDEILSCESLEDMVAKVESLIAKQREYGEDRKDILYYFMRDHWLYRWHSLLSQMAVADNEEEDE